jgi:hypothetical protein
MFVNVAVVTVNEAVAVMEPYATVIVVWPGVSPVANPFELIPATEAEEDSQDSPAVTGWMLPSL